MNYCDKCHIATLSNLCPNCGSDNLREVEQGDFCLVAELELLYAKMMQNSLQQQSIPCVLQPVGSTAIALYSISKQMARIYVPYEYYQQAKELQNAYYKS